MIFQDSFALTGFQTHSELGFFNKIIAIFSSQAFLMTQSSIQIFPSALKLQCKRRKWNIVLLKSYIFEILLDNGTRNVIEFFWIILFLILLMQNVFVAHYNFKIFCWRPALLFKVSVHSGQWRSIGQFFRFCTAFWETLSPIRNMKFPIPILTTLLTVWSTTFFMDTNTDHFLNALLLLRCGVTFRLVLVVGEKWQYMNRRESYSSSQLYMFLWKCMWHQDFRTTGLSGCWTEDG